MKRTTFDFPIPISRNCGEPIRAQVIRALRSAVRNNRLTPGSPLPSTRVLAEDLVVSRGLVVEAYEQLVAEGYFVAHRGSATRVAKLLPAAVAKELGSGAGSLGRTELRPPPRFDFRPGIPDVSQFPERAWMRAVRRAWAHGPSAALDYPDPWGIEAVRVALATYLNRSRATVADPTRVVMCTGFAQAARLACEVLHSRGARRIAVEDPGHADQCADLRAAGLSLVPVPVDTGGLRVDLLDTIDADAVLVTPAHQYPTGAVLEPARRTALLEWATRRQAYILEDDYDAEYRYDREPVGALQGLAAERVVYIGSASKMLAPSLRQGWLVLPGDLVAGVRQAKLSADRGSPSLEQRALAAFLDAGELDRHLRRTRAIYGRRRDALVAALSTHLPQLRMWGAAAGLHLLVSLPADTDEEKVILAAAEEDVRVYGARVYYSASHSATPALLLGYGAVSERDIQQGVGRLRRAIEKSRRS